jgi:arylsulfatase A
MSEIKKVTSALAARQKEMDRRRFLKTSAAALAGAGLARWWPSPVWAGPPDGPKDSPRSKRPPNVIFVLADDLGFETLGAYGAKTYAGLGPVKTPNLDALAKNGMKFTRCFATPVCSPARSELLTGQYNFHTGFIDIANRRGAVGSLDAQKHPTLPALLKDHDYITGVTGKWHLGAGPKGFPRPDQAQTDSPHVRACGFEQQYIFGGGHLVNYGAPKVGEYTPQWFHQWALKFIEDAARKDQPFFLYYASPIPHDPLKPTPLNPDGPANGGANFPFLIEYLDAQVGELVRKVKDLALSERTIVFFSGDNGTSQVTTEMADGTAIHGGKGRMSDAGAWVPLLASWPGTVRPGSVCEDLVDFTDVLPTVAELAGLRPAGEVDGVSFAPQLLGRTGRPREWVCVYYVDQYFLRDKQWKLRENGDLYNVTQSPLKEELVAPEKDTPESKAARQRLKAVADKLNPKAAAEASAKPTPGKRTGQKR